MNKKIYNHDIMICTHEAVRGNYLFSGRVLGTTEPEDLIQLHPDLKSQWQFITAHYDRIGLSHSKNVIWDVSHTLMSKYPDYDISVFIFGDVVHNRSVDHKWFHQIDPNWFEVVEYVNSKNNFIELAEKLDVKVPQTSCFEDKTKITNWDDFVYPCYLKPAVSVDGVGIYRCQDQQQLKEALKEFDDKVPLQIQQEVNSFNFLNLQYRISDRGLERFAATEQVLDGYAHQGNRYPTKHQPWSIIEPMAEWMYQQGMKEIFAFDVAVVETETDPSYYAIECNPRFNGASYPTGIAQKFQIPSWTCENFETKYRSLVEIDLKDLEFDLGKQTGVIVVNWGTILTGRIGILLAGTVKQQKELRAIIKQRLD